MNGKQVIISSRLIKMERIDLVQLTLEVSSRATTPVELIHILMLLRG